MRTRLFIQAIMIFLTHLGWSQITIHYEGHVLSEQNDSLVGVLFTNSASHKVIAISDSRGYYSFDSDTNKIIASHLGYEDNVILPSLTALVMVEKSGLLDAVVVSENKKESALKTATISLEIISPELIENTGPTNIAESIGRINGVQVVDNQPSIRSGSGWSYGAGSRVQVLVDGVPLLSGDAGQALWNFVPTEGIESVEVIKGASSVIYGSSALNGVINIKTKKSQTKPYTQITSSGGFYDLPKRETLHYNGNKRNTVANLTAYHTGKYKELGVVAGLNLLRDEGYKMSDYDHRIRGHLGLEKVVPKKNLIYGIKGTYQQGNSGSFLLWESYDSGYSAPAGNATENKVNRLSIDPYLKWNKGAFTHTLNTRYLSINNVIENVDTTNNQSNSSTLGYAEYKVGYSLPMHQLDLVGGLVTIATVSKSPLFGGDQHANNYSAYIQASKKWNRLTLTAGGRYEHFILNDREEGKPVFRTGLNYQLATYTFLRGSYGQGYRFPSIAESYITTTVGEVSIFPNDQLKSETSSNVEFGVKQGFEFKGVQMLLDAAWFRMDFQNMMEFTFAQWGPAVPPSYGGGFKTLNTGKTRVGGGEINLSFQKKNKDVTLQGFVGYTLAITQALEPDKIVGTDISGNKLTYLSTSSSTEDNTLKYRPKHQWNADIMLNLKKWSFGFGGAYQSQVQNIDTAFVSIPISLFVPGVQTSIDKKLTQFLLLNMRIGYRFSDALKFNLITSNLSNREYAIRPADIGAPRTVRLQVSYTIDKAK